MNPGRPHVCRAFGRDVLCEEEGHGLIVASTTLTGESGTDDASGPNQVEDAIRLRSFNGNVPL